MINYRVVGIMNDEKVREVLENSENDISVFPDDLYEGIELGDFPLISPNSEIDYVDFEEQDGMYMIALKSGELYEMCAICGEIQPMNMEAMEKFDSNIAEEMRENNNKPRWNNNVCEQRHPPFRPKWVG